MLRFSLRSLFPTLAIIAAAATLAGCDQLQDVLDDIHNRGGIGGAGGSGPGMVGEGQPCGGFVANARVCEPGLFCMQAAGTCNVEDIGGTCQPVPEVCTTIYAPVCGCDGKTYGSDCGRRAAKVTLDHEGVCGMSGGQFGDRCGGIGGLPCSAGLFCEMPVNTVQLR